MSCCCELRGHRNAQSWRWGWRGTPCSPRVQERVITNSPALCQPPLLGPTALHRNLRAPFPGEGECSPRGRQAPGRGTPSTARRGTGSSVPAPRHPAAPRGADAGTAAPRLPRDVGASLPRSSPHAAAPAALSPRDAVPRLPDAPRGADPCNARAAGAAGDPLPVLPILRSSPRPGMPLPRSPPRPGMPVSRSPPAPVPVPAALRWRSPAPAAAHLPRHRPRRSERARRGAPSPAEPRVLRSPEPCGAGGGGRSSAGPGVPPAALAGAASARPPAPRSGSSRGEPGPGVPVPSPRFQTAGARFPAAPASPQTLPSSLQGTGLRMLEGSPPDVTSDLILAKPAGRWAQPVRDRRCLLQRHRQSCRSEPSRESGAGEGSPGFP